MNKHTFLVEIGTEELPAKSLRALAENFAIQIRNELDTAVIYHGKVSWFATPRRLAVKVVEVDNNYFNKEIKKRGPAVSEAFDKNGNPTKLAESWARCYNIKINQAERLLTKKGEWLVYRTKKKDKPIQVLLYKTVVNALEKLPISKIMRWSNNNIKFIRPVHTVTILLDNNIIPGKVFGIDVNRLLLGHRFMGDQEIILGHADQYVNIMLERGRVIVDYLQRKEIIRQNIELAAKKLGGIIDISNKLLEEVTSLVEWPVVLTACFKKQFLEIPKEVIIFIMKSNQKFFPVYDTGGNLISKFIFVANIESKNPRLIINGNEKVLSTRLADAEFFFNADRKQRLVDRLPYLNKVIFQKQLGTLRDKSNRIEALAAWTANLINTDVVQAARAGLLSKCDLVTNMVFEFTNIQGIIGMHYALYDGELELVALAQKEQYYPRFAGDILPTTLVSCAVAIADKIDTIVGIYGIGQYIKGNKDPFALRRATLGILRIIIEKNLPIDFKKLTEKAVSLYNQKLTNVNVIEDVMDLMFSRFYSYYQDKGYNLNVIKAVLACRPTQPVDFDARVRAINYFYTIKEASFLTRTNKRISKILAKADNLSDIDFKTTLLKEPAEIMLYNYLLTLNKKLNSMFKNSLYQDILVELTSLCEPVDDFFRNVMVMTNNSQLCVNRLLLLSQLRELFLQIADISLL